MSEKKPDLNGTTRRSLMIGLAGLATGCRSELSGPLPEVTLAPMKGLMSNTGWAVGGVDFRKLTGQVVVLNIWASWCPYCRSEKDILRRLSADRRFVLAGLVHQDSEDNARGYLRQAGNPYSVVSVDAEGLITKPLKQRGVPHTYVIGRDRKVLKVHPGALSDEAVNSIIRPAIEKALSASA